ncbi:MAG: permease-like cell division protein FtsX [Prevotella sp.]|nr:permease-like cell division protein FtsX [Prevotella sp.]MBR4368241.1 permease-like cell division protein FtsX [Prevotella sp.]MBR7048504.1 permease-like cell division protein FtsX [Prevotella sp.]
MGKNRKKSRNRTGLQVVTLCISTAMVLILLGMVVLTVFTGKNLSSYAKERLTVTMILAENMTDPEAQNLCEKVKTLPYIAGINYVSKEQALKEGTKELGADPSEFAGMNPFTASIELQLKPDYANNDSIAKISKQLQQYKKVSEIDYRQDLINSVNKTLRKISFVLLILAALLTVVSFSLINNTVRLSVYARRFSIHTMKLVGASWGFIREPFLKRAVGQGFVSALIALVILGSGVYGLYQYEPEMQKFLTWEELAITAGTVLLFGVLITTLCAWGSVNKFLRMKAGDLYKI